MQILKYVAVFVVCFAVCLVAQTEPEVIMRKQIGSKSIIVTNHETPTAFGHTWREISVDNPTAPGSHPVRIVRIPQYLDVASIDAVDTVLAVIALRQGEQSLRHPYIVFPLAPNVGRLEFPGWWVSDAFLLSTCDQLEKGEYIVEHCPLNSYPDDHVLILRSSIDTLFQLDVYFCDAEKLSISFKDDSTLQVDYEWKDSGQRYDFEITLWNELGDEIAIRPVATGESGRAE